jgi:BlaI family transcriptional regulator, penicillinase repressor
MFCFVVSPRDFRRGRPGSSGMPRHPQDVTDAELAILNVLWERGSATVRELATELYGKNSASQHATVQKLLERLEAKECVTRSRKTWPYTFSPAIDRESRIGHQLQQTADKLCGGSLQPLLTHLVKAGRLTAEDRKSLRDLLDELNPANKRRGNK